MTTVGRPTLRDVARLSGLSVTQTSRALNGHADVAVDTRERANVAARELGYIPNMAARRLKVPDSRTHSLGLVLVASQRFSDPFLGDLLTTMVDEATSCGYELQLAAPLAQEDSTESYRRAIQTRRVDGFILLRTQRDDPRANYLAEAGFPFVTFGHLEHPRGSPALAEADGGLAPMIAHLVEKGHRRVAFLSEPLGYSLGAGRHQSFHQAMDRLDIRVDPRLVVPAGFHADSAVVAANRLLTGDDPPTAIVASNDLLALGAMRAAAARGLSVPDQLSVTGFNDISAAQFSSPPLTTMRYPDGVIGRGLVAQLIQVIEGARDVPDRYVKPELVVRGSTAPPVR